MYLLTSMVVLVISQVHRVHGYGSGAPPAACATMIPSHDFLSEQTYPIPVTLTTTGSSYTPGGTLTLTLTTTGGNFKGFMVQARDAADVYTPVGTMITTDSSNSQALSCSGTLNSITHIGPAVKTSIAFQWQATPAPTGAVTFYVTVVQDFSTFWAAKNLLVLSEDTGGSVTTNPPLPQTSTVSPTLTSTLTSQTTQLIPQGSSSRSPAPSRSTTEQDVKLTLSPTGTGPRKLSVKGGNIMYDNACGSSKGCFVNCEGGTCTYMVTWRDVGTAVQFELYGKPGYRDAWIAVGFSSDTKMGGDSVTECVSNNGRMDIFNSENVFYSNRRLAGAAAQAGLFNPSGSYNEGVMYCSFTRQKSVAGVPQLLNLDQDWNIMFASGEAMTMPAWNVKKHSQLPPVSASKVDYQSFAVIGSGVKYTLVKAHGCLMILSWVLFVGVGIVAARYYKSVWAEKTFLNLKIWFQIHRGCMVTAVLLNVVAFVIIFIDVGGYSEIDVPGKQYLSSHPILGIIVTALCLTNPIMALFRPGPDHSKRPLFNWAHWGVGMAAYILSAICICFGFQLGKSSTPDYAIYIMIVYILHIIIFDLIYELLECMMKKQKKSKVDNVEMTTQNGTDTPIPNGHYQTKESRKSHDRIKTVLLAVHVAFTGAFALVLVLVVALN